MQNTWDASMSASNFPSQSHLYDLGMVKRLWSIQNSMHLIDKAQIEEKRLETANWLVIKKQYQDIWKFKSV